MADIDKIKLPNNTVVNIKDSRIPGVDTEPTSGSDNVVTSDGIYDAINDAQVWEAGSGNNSAVLKGSEGTASDDYSTVEGYKSITGGNYTENTIRGLPALSSEKYQHAEGFGTIASGGASHSEGHKTLASGNRSHAEGYKTLSSGDRSHAEGYNTIASSDSSHAEGYFASARGVGSHAEGNGTIAHGDNSHAEGFNTYAYKSSSHTEGYYTTTYENNSHAEGSYTTAAGNSSHAEGANTLALGTNSHAEGSDGNWVRSNFTVSGTASSKTYTYTTDEVFVLSGGNIVRGDNITIITSTDSINKTFTTRDFLFNSDVENVRIYYKFNGAIGDYSHTEGLQTYTKGASAHAEGNSSHAEGNASHAEGENTRAKGNASHAEGHNSFSSGWASHAEGIEGVAEADASHAEGHYTVASGDNSHAEGLQTESSGENSHAEGNETIAQGVASHAEGVNTEAIGTGSHTEGVGTVANNNGEHAEGLYNKSNSSTISSIGIGSADDYRKNALECLSNGRIYVYDVGGYAGTSISGNSLSVHLKTNAINNREWNFIFDIFEPTTNYLCCLYIDDFPDSSCWENHGFDSLEDLVESICELGYDESVDGSPLYGVNLFMPLTETVEYEGKIYDLWEIMTYYQDHSRFNKGSVYGLLSQDATYTELHNNSMEVDVTNEYYPFSIVSVEETPDEGGTIYANSENYRLIKAKQIPHISNPIDANHSSTIQKIILDDFSNFSFYAQVYNYVGSDSINDFIDEIKTNGYSSEETFINTGSTFTYEGVEYDIWANELDGCYGGLMPHNITYQDLYPHSIECDSRNIYTKYCPFVVRYNDDNGETVYPERENTDNYTTLICVI